MSSIISVLVWVSHCFSFNLEGTIAVHRILHWQFCFVGFLQTIWLFTCVLRWQIWFFFPLKVKFGSTGEMSSWVEMKFPTRPVFPLRSTTPWKKLLSEYFSIFFVRMWCGLHGREPCKGTAFPRTLHLWPPGVLLSWANPHWAFTIPLEGSAWSFPWLIQAT